MAQPSRLHLTTGARVACGAVLPVSWAASALWVPWPSAGGPPPAPRCALAPAPAGAAPAEVIISHRYISPILRTAVRGLHSCFKRPRRVFMRCRQYPASRQRAKAHRPHGSRCSATPPKRAAAKQGGAPPVRLCCPASDGQRRRENLDYSRARRRRVRVFRHFLIPLFHYTRSHSKDQIRIHCGSLEGSALMREIG